MSRRRPTICHSDERFVAAIVHSVAAGPGLQRIPLGRFLPMQQATALGLAKWDSSAPAIGATLAAPALNHDRSNVRGTSKTRIVIRQRGSTERAGPQLKVAGQSDAASRGNSGIWE